MVKGDTFVRSITMKRDGVAVDITGATILFTLKLNVSDAANTVQVSGVLTTPTSGIFSVTLDPSDTSSIAAANYHYDIEITESDSVKTTLLKGRINVEPEITT